MKKYIICSFCFIMIICSAYVYNYDRLRNSKDTQNDAQSLSVNFTDNTIKSDALLITENYTLYPNGDNELNRTQGTMPSIYLGMTRADVILQLENYMEHRSIKDLEDGLIQFDLVYFSSDCMILRKTYEIDEDYHKYFIKFSKGSITVFYSDQQTVYEYTDIPLTALPPTVAADIMTGIKIKDEKELFDFLENYSS